MGGAGIDSLRAKSGIGERQLTEAASDVKSIDDATASLNKAEAAKQMLFQKASFKTRISFPGDVKALQKDSRILETSEAMGSSL